MVVIRPSEVRFGSDVWDAVERVTVDRIGTRVIREESDDGGSVVFVDVPERMVRAKVWQAIDQTTLDGPLPGEMEEVRVELGTGADEGRRLLRFDAVVESVTHLMSGTGATRVVSLIAVSGAGDEDPVSVTAQD